MIPAPTSSEFAGSLTPGMNRAVIRACRGLANELDRPGMSPGDRFSKRQWSLEKKQKTKR